MYVPPFKITKSIERLVAKINELTKIYESSFKSNKASLKDKLVELINATCAIEANSLSLDETRAIIEGKEIIADQNEIKEIENANLAYKMSRSLNPFSELDLLKAHEVLMKDLTKRNGKYRLNEEGVYSGNICVFIAPPPQMVPRLMKDLFNWLNRVKETLSPLIYASVFHYEFVFIHPFLDGNGRTARLWNTILLKEHSNSFVYLGLEKEIWLHQSEYYEVINASHKNGDSTTFITFILKMIIEALKKNMFQN